MNKLVINTNFMTVLMSFVSIICLTISVLSLINQKKLNDIIAMQDAKISELIKIKKDLLFSKEVNNDGNITSIAELKQMIKELKDTPMSNYNVILGETSPEITPTP